MNAYRVVQQFEEELCIYTGATFAVSVNSGSMALLLACRWFLKDAGRIAVRVPRRTYNSVPMSVIHAGGVPDFAHLDWCGAYELFPLPVWDSARRFTGGMYRAGQFQCVSFHTSKILGIEQGGAILHDNHEADEWLRRARFDGRLNAEEKIPQQIGWHCYFNPSTAALALSRLACLPRHNADQAGAKDFPDISALPIWPKL